MIFKCHCKSSLYFIFNGCSRAPCCYWVRGTLVYQLLLMQGLYGAHIPVKAHYLHKEYTSGCFVYPFDKRNSCWVIKVPTIMVLILNLGTTDKMPSQFYESPSFSFVFSKSVCLVGSLAQAFLHTVIWAYTHMLQGIITCVYTHQNFKLTVCKCACASEPARYIHLEKLLMCGLDLMLELYFEVSVPNRYGFI